MATRMNLPPPLTRGLLLGLFTLSLLNAASRYRSWVHDGTSSIDSRIYYAPFLTIVPGTSIIYPWVLLTATLAEQNLFGLLITGVSLFYGGRYLERAWSSREYSKFILIIALGPNLATFFSYIALFAITGNEGLITTAISGGIAIQAAFLVAFKQLVPEHTVTILRGLISTRVKHFPAIFLVANTVSGLAFGTDTAMLLAWYGFFISWVYLRFYRISPSLVSSATGDGATIRGDASDTFAFACFFPDAIQPPISAACNVVYNTLVSLRICTPFSAADIDASNDQANVRGETDLPSLLYPGRGSGRREEAERRRALALRALDQRLHANTSKGTPRPAPTEPRIPTPQPAQESKPEEPQNPPQQEAPSEQPQAAADTQAT